MKKVASTFSKAFTLVELLIVIAIIGILTVAFLPSIRGAPGKARDASKRQLLSDVQNVLENMINDGNDIPNQNGGVAFNNGICINDYAAMGSTGLALVTALGHAPQTFGPVTGNPLCGGGQLYYRKFSSTSYAIAIGVENASGANVIQATTADNISKLVDGKAGVTATNGAVGTGETNGGQNYFYFMLVK